MGKRIDAWTDTASASDLQLLVNECYSLLETASGEDRVLTYYFRANAYSGIAATKHDDDNAWSWEQTEVVAALLLLRYAIDEPAFDTLDPIRRCQIRTNLASKLNCLGRFVEALEQWHLVIQENPFFAMALGNMDSAIGSYAQHLYDSGHVGVFLKAASEAYSTALAEEAFWDNGPDTLVQGRFSRGLAEVNAHLEATEFDHSMDLSAFSLGKTVDEQRYRRWCLQERLFLNPLNDITTATVASTDVLHLPSHVYNVGDAPRFPAYYNHLKQEYVSARFRVYQYQSIDPLKGHFVDHGVLILDSADGGEFGHHVDQLRTAFRSAYGLFDKVALFLNDYFSVGMESRDVSFRKVWGEQVGNPRRLRLRVAFNGYKNWPLRGLYYLSKDLFDEGFSSAAAPDARELVSLRNHAGHRFLTLQQYSAGSSDSDDHLYVPIDSFFAKTMRIVRMARAALTYLSLAMYREEAIRSTGAEHRNVIPSMKSIRILRTMGISDQTNERAFEVHVAETLLGASGWKSGTNAEWDVERALFPAQVCGFLESTQPKLWSYVRALHGDGLEQLLLTALVKELNLKGALHVLRHGFKFYGKTFRLATFKPAHGLNDDVLALYQQNQLTLTRQVFCHPGKHDTVDLVFALNGLPVATCELKNPDTGQSWRHAVSQYQTNRDPRAPLFRFKARALVHFAADADEVHMTTRLSRAETQFLPFNRGSQPGESESGAGNPQHPSGYRTGYFWHDVLRRDSFLDILGHFLFVETHEQKVENGKGGQRQVTKKTLIFPRYHQLEAVRKIIAAAREDGAGRNYLIQHSAGSGKTNSISWLAHRLASLHDDEDRKLFDCVIVITDRRVLDRQLQDAIYQIEHAQGVVKAIDRNSRQLAEALIDGTKIVITTLQKFPFVLRGLLHVAGAETQETASPAEQARAQAWAAEIAKRRYAVIVDEAHSSQTGETARELKAILGTGADEDGEGARAARKVSHLPVRN